MTWRCTSHDFYSHVIRVEVAMIKVEVYGIPLEYPYYLIGTQSVRKIQSPRMSDSSSSVDEGMNIHDLHCYFYTQDGLTSLFTFLRPSRSKIGAQKMYWPF